MQWSGCFHMLIINEMTCCPLFLPLHHPPQQALHPRSFSRLDEEENPVEEEGEAEESIVRWWVAPSRSKIQPPRTSESQLLETPPVQPKIKAPTSERVAPKKTESFQKSEAPFSDSGLIDILLSETKNLCQLGRVTETAVSFRTSFNRQTMTDCKAKNAFYDVLFESEGRVERNGFMWEQIGANNSDPTLPRFSNVFLVYTDQNPKTNRYIQEEFSEIPGNEKKIISWDSVKISKDQLNPLLYLLLEAPDSNAGLTLRKQEFYKILEQVPEISKKWPEITRGLRAKFYEEGYDVRLESATPIAEVPVTGTHALECPLLKSLEEKEQCKITDINRLYRKLNTNEWGIMLFLMQAAVNSCLGGLIYIAVDEEKRRMQIYKEELIPCSKTLKAYSIGLTFGPFDFSLPLASQGEEAESKSGGPYSRHAMILLLDEKTKTGELFEPNSPRIWWVEPVRRLLTLRFRPQGWATIDSPLLFCPVVSLQDVVSGELREKGLCLAIVSIYVALRVSCPNIPKEELVKQLSQLGRVKLAALIANFLCFVGEVPMQSYEDIQKRIAEKSYG